jgi:2-dehydro-3-deoxygalactonokinase
VIVAVDWGTSSLRAARLDADGRAVEEREFPRGILTVPPGAFAQVFEEACGDWMKASGSIALVCGMAGSRQGWKEAPYAPCPASFAMVAAKLTWAVRGRVAIVPGLSCDGDGVPDVMRGEETTAFGIMTMLGMEDGRIVMPGTHSKWVSVRGGRIDAFETFMTGEFYSLLRQHSILARTMSAQDGELDEAALLRGVDHAMQRGNLLHSAFAARTLSLFDRLDANTAPNYLSGLVIGEELRSQYFLGGGPLVLAGADKLTRRYAVALEYLGAPFRTVGQQATWLGLHAIAQELQ